MAPDLDVLIRSSQDGLLAIEYHRHFTHSLAFVPAGAMVVALVLWPLLGAPARNLSFARFYLWAVLGYGSHGLLDAMTSYGTRLLWPLSDLRAAWNVISVIDPLFTLPLMLLLGLALWRMRPRWAGVAAGWCVLYLAAGAFQQQRAESLTEAWASANGIEAERVVAKPGFANLVLWRGLVDDGERLHVVAVRILPGREPMLWAGGSVAKYTLDRAPAGSRLRVDLERFEHFSAGWLFAHEAGALPGERFLGDFRYAIDPGGQAPLWGIRFDPDRPEVGVRFDRTSDVGTADRVAFFARLAGRDPPAREDDPVLLSTP
jgi:inner membrane protein